MAPITLTLEIIEADDLQQVILDIIQNAIQPNTDGHESILAAAQAIDDLFPDRCFNEGEQRTAYSFLFRLWEGFPGFAKQIPYDSEEADRLVSLVRTLAKEIPPRHIRPRDSYGDTLWDGLPELIDALDENIGSESCRLLLNTMLLSSTARLAVCPYNRSCSSLHQHIKTLSSGCERQVVCV